MTTLAYFLSALGSVLSVCLLIWLAKVAWEKALGLIEQSETRRLDIVRAAEHAKSRQGDAA